MKTFLTAILIAYSSLSFAVPTTLEGLGLITEWTDIEGSSNNNMPSNIWGTSSADMADSIGIYVEYGDGLFGSLTYSGVKNVWGDIFSNIYADTATGFFELNNGLHFLDVAGSLPMAWSNNVTPYSGNFDLDYNGRDNSWRASTAGWGTANIGVYSSAYSSSSAIPEPSIIALMALGIFGLSLSRRKMKK